MTTVIIYLRTSQELKAQCELAARRTYGRRHSLNMWAIQAFKEKLINDSKKERKN